MEDYDPHIAGHLQDDSMISNSRQWDAVWPDGDLFTAGFQNQALYVSPARDLVIVFFLVSLDRTATHYLRPIATSKLFEK